MSTTCNARDIQLSPSTHEQLGSAFVCKCARLSSRSLSLCALCRYRGEVPVKGKGIMRTHLLLDYIPLIPGMKGERSANSVAKSSGNNLVADAGAAKSAEDEVDEAGADKRIRDTIAKVTCVHRFTVARVRLMRLSTGNTFRKMANCLPLYTACIEVETFLVTRC